MVIQREFLSNDGSQKRSFFRLVLGPLRLGKQLLLLSIK